MRKRYVSDDELNQIIRLKQSGASWLMVQDQTGVPRRSAKQAYEDWQRNQSIEELKAARVDVAAEEFRIHVDILLKLADSIAVGLKAPETPQVTMDADQFLESLWEKIYRELHNYQPDKRIEHRERRRLVREFQMLLKALEYHTREKVHWQLLEQWKEGWNTCIAPHNKLEQEAITIAASIREKETKLIEYIDNRSEQYNAAERMAESILQVIWKSIVDDTFDPDNPKIEFNFDLVDRTVSIPDENDLYKRVADIMSKVAAAFCVERKKSIILPLLADVRGLNEAISAIEEMLNPLVLRPLILRTRCDLCPA